MDGFIADNFFRDQPPRKPTIRINAKLAELRDRLRDQASFENFLWNFGYFLKRNCTTSGCALGLAASVMTDFPVFRQVDHRADGKGVYYSPSYLDAVAIAKYFGVDYELLDRLFFGGSIEHTYGADRSSLVGPGDVADAIDWYDEHGALDGFADTRVRKREQAK